MVKDILVSVVFGYSYNSTYRPFRIKGPVFVVKRAPAVGKKQLGEYFPDILALQ